MSNPLTKKATTTLVPHLVCTGAADAIAFYGHAFNAVEQVRLPARNGKLMHASICIGGAQVMLIDEAPECGALSPKSLNGTPVTINLSVADADAVFDQAIAAGAKSVMPMADMFWGDRYGLLEDPFGHRWAIFTPQRVLSPDELRHAAAEFESAVQP